MFRQRGGAIIGEQSRVFNQGLLALLGSGFGGDFEDCGGVPSASEAFFVAADLHWGSLGEGLLLEWVSISRRIHHAGCWL
ncbi:hypothetical protein V6N13_137978 [Hibiscus sabdariffa]